MVAPDGGLDSGDTVTLATGNTRVSYSLVAERARLATDPAGALARVLSDHHTPGAWWRNDDGQVTPYGRVAQVALAYLDALGVLALPDADPGKIPDSVCDAFETACLARAAQCPGENLEGADADREAIRAGLAAAMWHLGPPGHGMPSVDERAVDAFWRSALYASSADALALAGDLSELSRRAVAAGLAGAVRAGLALHMYSGSSVEMVIVHHASKEPEPCPRCI